MGYLQNAVIIMLSIASVFLIAQFSIFQINPVTSNSENYTLIKCSSLAQSKLNPACINTNPVDSYAPTTPDLNNNTLIHPEQATSDPQATQTYNIVNVITSVFSYVTAPFTLGYSVLSSVISLPFQALKQMGLPPGIIWTIAGLIVIMTLFYISDWIKGGLF